MRLPSARRECSSIRQGVAATQEGALLCFCKAIWGFKVEESSTIGVFE